MIGVLANFLGTEPRDAPDAEPGAAPRQGPPHPESAAVVTDDELIDRLVDKFREGEVTDEQRRTLQQHLRLDRSTPVEVKLGHLQQRVADLEAYADALEAFIDAEGAGRDILDDLRADIDDLHQARQTVGTRVTTLEDDHSALLDRVARVDDAVASLESHVREVEGRHSREIAGVDAKVDHVERTVEAALDGVHDDIDRLHERLGGAQSSIDSVADDVQALQALEPVVAGLESDLEQLESLGTEVDRLAEGVDAIEAELHGLDDLRDRLATVEQLPAELASVKHELADLEAFRARFVDVVTAEATAPGRR